ncbi:hypothetical protein [Glutamicibacter arilaitensis]|uniref:hypothetical protein n=1 Tax=Glutamicibacter arilaitensis TaxID=256701 RepID=UPI003F93A732
MKNKHKCNRQAAALLAIGAFALSGCAIQSEPAESSKNMSNDAQTLQIGTAEDPMVWDGSLVETADTLNEVAAQSSLSVVAVAKESRVEHISDVPFTVTTIEVKETVSGRASASVLEIRQFGDEFNTDAHAANVLESGHTYLLSLKPFELELGEDTGQWVLIGGVSSWEKTGPDQYVNTAEVQLPETLSKRKFVESMND